MSEEIFKINVGNHSFDLTASDAKTLDAINNGNTFHILQDGKSFDVVVESKGEYFRHQTIIVNGNRYEVDIESPLDQMLSTMGMSANSQHQIKDIKAPMPGLILEIMVETGQEIAKGDPLLILEAMKMENVLKSEGDGIIESIKVKKGESVEKGQIIIAME